MMKHRMKRLAVAAVTLTAAVAVTATAAVRSSKHTEYANRLLKYVDGYTVWTKKEDLSLPVGPPLDENDVAYLNSKAAGSQDYPYGSVIVAEHRDDEGKTVAKTIFYRVRKDYDKKYRDWYFVHYAGGEIAKTSADNAPLSKRGFVTKISDGRLWVFRTASPALAEYLTGGEPAKHVIRPGAGPGGMTVKSSDTDVIMAYMAAKDGYYTKIEDGRIWVFRAGSENAKKFKAGEDFAKIAVRPAAGPTGATVKSVDSEVITEYLTAKPGYVTRATKEGRLWVFEEGSEELAEFESEGEPAKFVTLPSGGPHGMTLKGPSTDVINGYIAAQPGFVTVVKEGRIWVFRDGSEAHKTFKDSGEPAKFVIRPAAGPRGMTVKGAETEVINAYIEAAKAAGAIKDRVASVPRTEPKDEPQNEPKDEPKSEPKDEPKAEPKDSPAPSAGSDKYSKPGFVTEVKDGRLWIFREGSEHYAEYKKSGEPAKFVILPAAGPDGMTLKGAEMDTLQGYLVARPGFYTEVKDGRIWVFKEGSEALAEFKKSGEPAKFVIRPAAGPRGMTVKGAEKETIDAYLKAVGK